MPRDGSRTLSDLEKERLAIVCEKCGRRGSYAVARLISAHGDMRLTDLIFMLTSDCPRKAALSLHDRCAAKFEF
jgi:hypothetical protein